MPNPEERRAQWEALAWEAVDELQLRGRCSRVVATEDEHHPYWRVSVFCDGEQIRSEGAYLTGPENSE